eukprot:300910_1
MAPTLHIYVMSPNTVRRFLKFCMKINQKHYPHKTRSRIKPIQTICRRYGTNLAHLCDVTEYSQKILEILYENKPETLSTQDTITNKAKQGSPTSTCTNELSEYQNQMNAFLQTRTTESITDGWQLFHDTKSNIHLSDIDAFYSPVIKLIITADIADTSSHIPSRKAFNRMIALKEEIDDKNNNETATVQCDIMMINSCLKVKQYRKAMDIYKSMFKNKEKHKYFGSTEFCETILKFYGENNYVFEGINYLKDVQQKYGIIASNKMITACLRSIAYNINKENKSMYLRSVEMLFEQAFGDTNLDKYPNLPVFQALLDIYSKLGAAETCYNIIQYVDNPNVICYNLVLKSCVQCDDEELLRRKGDGWDYIDYIVDQMEKHNISKNEYVYDNLFLFCSKNTALGTPNFERLNAFYKEMVNGKIQNMSWITMNDWWMAGMDWFEYQMHNDGVDVQCICDELDQFKDLAIAECERCFGESKIIEMRHNIESRAASIQLLTEMKDYKMENTF